MPPLALDRWNRVQASLRAGYQAAEANLQISAAKAAKAMEMDSVFWERREGQHVPFSQQADIAFHNAEAYEHRARLRRAPLVREALHQWWWTVPHKLIPRPNDGIEVEVIERDVYCAVLRAVYGALAHDDEWDDEELDSQIEEDWATDARGENSMSRELFLDSMFELADIWSTSMDERGYELFLSDLLEHVKPAMVSMAARGNPGSDERTGHNSVMPLLPPELHAAHSSSLEEKAHRRRQLIAAHSSKLLSGSGTLDRGASQTATPPFQPLPSNRWRSSQDLEEVYPHASNRRKPSPRAHKLDPAEQQQQQPSVALPSLSARDCWWAQLLLTEPPQPGSDRAHFGTYGMTSLQDLPGRQVRRRPAALILTSSTSSVLLTSSGCVVVP